MTPVSVETGARALFSIVLPVFNRSTLVGEAVESVLAQSERDWELVIVDDASTDGTPRILERFEVDSRVRILRNERNLERSASRNRGIAAARGLYICFLDSDDWYLPEHLGVLRGEIERQGRPAALFYTGFRRLFTLSKKEVSVPAVMRANPVESVVANHLPTNTVAIHRDILVEHRFDESMTIWEDVHLFARIASRYPLIPCSGVTTVWRTHGASSQHTVADAPGCALAALKRILELPEVGPNVSEGGRRRIRADLYSSQVESELAAGRRLLALLAVARLAGQRPEFGQIASRALAVLYSLPGGGLMRRVIRLRRSIVGPLER